MNRTRPSSRSAQAAFTLIELMMVVVIMSIVAVTVIPAVDNVRVMRAGAAHDDVARLLEVTKARAMASGSPVGLRVDLADSTLTLVEVDPSVGITNLADPLTGADRILRVRETYSDVSIASLINGDGDSGTGIIWFDFESTPHTRNTDGDFASISDDHAIITLSSGATVIVHAHSGFVEKP